MISFWVAGMPAPKGSFRISRRARGVTVRKDSPKTETWHRLVAWAAKVAMRGCGQFVGVPIEVLLEFYLPRPESVPKRRTWPMVKPDADKLARATLDPMEGIVFDQDSRVVMLIVQKRYASDETGCRITVTPVSP